MNDRDTTISALKKACIDMCLRKGWGDKNGIQDPMHVCMAMTVEMSEVLEHFQWLEPKNVKAMMEGRDPERVAAIGEEFADVMIYGLQMCNALGIDVAENIFRKIEINNHRTWADEPAPKE